MARKKTHTDAEVELMGQFAEWVGGLKMLTTISKDGRITIADAHGYATEWIEFQREMLEQQGFCEHDAAELMSRTCGYLSEELQDELQTILAFNTDAEDQAT